MSSPQSSASGQVNDKTQAQAQAQAGRMRLIGRGGAGRPGPPIDAPVTSTERGIMVQLPFQSVWSDR
jgi:hypothetical protein